MAALTTEARELWAGLDGWEIANQRRITNPFPLRLRLTLPEPKHWHCGHSIKANWENALDSNAAKIAWVHSGGATSTKQQFRNFQLEAMPGDIIYLHTSSLGTASGLTHWGRYNGKVVTDYESNESMWMQSSISVDEWFPLPRGLAGQGLQKTLYQVSDPASLNYINYTITA
jgi:hypothetical protein